MKLDGIILPPDTLRLERLLPGPIERVWSFIVDAEKRARWFAGGLLEPRVGGRIDWPYRHAELSHEKETPARFAATESYHLIGTVTRWEPPHTLAFTWDYTEVIIALAAEGEKVRFTLTQLRVPPEMHVGVAAGLNTNLVLLDDALTGAPPHGFWSTFAAFEAAYATALASKQAS